MNKQIIEWAILVVTAMCANSTGMNAVRIYGKTKTCKIIKISKNYIEKEIGGLGQKKNIYPDYQCIFWFFVTVCFRD